MKFAEDEILQGLKTKEYIKNDWYTKWHSSGKEKMNSDFAVGAERIIYSLLNGKGIGQPNSAPVGSDLFFEVKDAFIHIDVKTIQTGNIDDYATSIPVGNNQNSYNGQVNKKEYKEASLPSYYNSSKTGKKPCLTYFITVLYSAIDLTTLNINILSMPNQELYKVYGKKALRPGKTQYSNKMKLKYQKTVRFNWSKCDNFTLIEGNPKRVKVAYFDEDNMTLDIQKKLTLIKKIHNNQFNL